MTDSLDFLVKTKPLWCSLLTRSKTHLELAIKIMTDRAFELFDLNVSQARSGSIHVREAQKKRLPLCCPDRHINPDGTFCTSYESTKPIKSESEAKLWWDGLHRYLGNQILADQVGKWPLTEGLSHGNAAVEFQMQIETLLSDRPALLIEALRGMFRRTGWLGATLPKFSRKGQLYGRPRVCPRRQCSTCRAAELNRRRTGVKPHLCPDLSLIRMATSLEVERRSKEKNFMKQLRKRHNCCGTLKQCSLRDYEIWY